MKKLSHNNAIYLQSEALKMISYDEERYILKATFNNNKNYQYLGVSITVWTDFLNTIYSGGSAGAFINKKIKPFYKYVEVT